MRRASFTSFAPLHLPACLRSGLRRAWAAGRLWLVVLAMALAAPAVQAESVSLDTFEISRSDEGLMLGFAARFELSKPIEEALQKGVPLFFVAQADVFRERWYWRDQQLGSSVRTWRLAYQPLTRKYRVTYGGLSQHYDNLSDALVAVSRTVNWKLLDASQLDDGKHYVEFSYQLDTTQMPRPMQIGIGGQADWALRVERTRRVSRP